MARSATRAAPRRSRTQSATTSARLGRYHAKRDLRRSGEPGDAASASVASREFPRYVIQKHDATRLHYDFRLEMEGVLRSWAVPKGLPEKPGDRALAIEVEDHPLSYGSFEGVIPDGNYGAGPVMLWDRGHYIVEGESPVAAYKKGKIHLGLVGEKCRGDWTLVRIRERGDDKKKNWIMLKNHDARRARGPAAAVPRDRSVLTGRTLDEICAGKPAKVRAPRRAAKKADDTDDEPAPAAAGPKTPARVRVGKAEFLEPMKALAVTAVPAGQWRLEIKFDGYRAIAVLNGGKISLWSRNRKPFDADYPEVIASLAKIKCRSAVLDGEVVALDAEGRSRFQLLQGRGRGDRPTLVYYVFDLLERDGISLLNEPLEQRQAALQQLLGRAQNDVVRISPVFDVPPDDLLREVRKQGLEGIIAKRAGSLYEPGRRSGTWVKCKVSGEQEFVIGGYTPPQNSRPHFGAILIGYHDADGALRYAGKVGSGFDHTLLAALHREFDRRKIAQSPFSDLPAKRRSRFGQGMTAAAMREVTWIKPELVAQVRFTEWTNDGSLRHPVFLGLRRDKKASEVVREAPPVSA